MCVCSVFEEYRYRNHFLTLLKHPSFPVKNISSATRYPPNCVDSNLVGPISYLEKMLTLTLD